MLTDAQLAVQDARRVLEYHRSMLTDEHRIRGFKDAIERSVKPGDRVIDLGCGTGILSMLACNAGAREVIAIESEPIAEVAHDVLRDNGYLDRVKLIRMKSTEVQIEGRADGLISETIGNMGLDEGIEEWVNDAWARLLRPGAFVIPRRIRVHVVPVDDELLYEDYVGSYASIRGFNYASMRKRSSNQLHWTEFTGSEFLSEPQVLLMANLEDRTPLTERTAEACFRVADDGTLHGFGCWFSAELCDGVSIGTTPPLSCPNWRHIYLPLHVPISVAKGDEIDLDLASYGGTSWRWRGQVRVPPATTVRFDHSTHQGLLHLPPA